MLLATVLGSSLAFVDATVVNVALPRIGTTLGAGAGGLQWVVNGYTVSLAALVLLGGALGDRYGRRRVFVLGVAWFAAASLLCAVAPSVGALVAARVLQGVGGALLTPGALAILEASFREEDRGRAIAAWSGLGGIAGALGPFLGGWLVEVGSWRLAFLVNLPLAAIAAAVAVRRVPETRAAGPARRLDVAGALTGVAGLAGLTYGLTAWPAAGLRSPGVLGALAAGAAGLAAFVLVERRAREPMLPLRLFAVRAFAAANVVTLAVYAALGGSFFFLGLGLQVVAGFSPLASGAALLPATVVMLVLSPRAGALAQRVGARGPLTAGPIAAAAALALLARVGERASYARDVLPGVLLLGLGLATLVAPVTATALGAVDERHAGVASGVNNAVARAAGLLAVAALPLAAGLRGGSLTDPAALAPAYRAALLLCAGLMLAGSAAAFVGIPRRGSPDRCTPSRPDARRRPRYTRPGRGRTAWGTAMTTPSRWQEHIEVGFQVFTEDGGDEVGAVRDVCPGGRPELLVYIENGGDRCIPLDAVVDVHSEKVIVDVTRLDPVLRRAVSRAHDAERPGL